MERNFHATYFSLGARRGSPALSGALTRQVLENTEVE